MNYIISEFSHTCKVIGLTSIGVDGEGRDVVTDTDKPRIYVSKGSLIATSKVCVLGSDITKEILDVTDICTPMGNVVIFRALSDGYVELVGPSINSQIKYICKCLNDYGADLAIVDGALSRKTLGSPSVTDATIFCSGAILNNNMRKAVEQIVFESSMLNLHRVEDKKFFSLYDDIKDCKVCIVNKDYTYKNLNIGTTLNTHKEVYDVIHDNSKYIFINGAITNNFIENFMKCGEKYKDVTVLVKDSTKIFLDKDIYDKFIKLKGCIKSVDKINLIGISINPTSINGYSFDEYGFIDSIQSKTDISVFNVMNFKY
ncbi:MAG: hypothetical protein ACRC3Y_13620 [Romboutsia sp.]|uniref:lysine 5,6-aminomutase reactivase subunit KamB n=1 Tax=Romboutsia sp. TaxID=1965302 RepID=UPI003F2AA84B